MPTVISVENLSKAYRLGQIGTGTLTRDLSVWWAKLRGKPNPMLKIGEKDHGNRDGETLWALKDVSFSLEQGEVLGIIGRNGAGKSTLLKVLSRVTAPTSGRVRAKGRIASLLEVGTGFHPELTGRENVYLNGAILGMTREEVNRKFDEIVDFSGVEQFIDTPVKRYSSGMYVRLAFAVAAHLEPEILLVDEVLAVGDAEFQKKCLGKMGEVAKEGRTVLFVSHNMGAIEALCPRSIMLSSGKVIQDGPSKKTIETYLKTADSIQIEDLAKRSDRKGLGDIRLKEFYVSTDGKTSTEILMTGQPAYFIFRIEPPRIGTSCRFTILDPRRTAVVHFNSSISTAEDEITNNPRGTFICKLDKLLLSPGNFTVNVLISEKSITQDHIENALAFRVEAGQSDGRVTSKSSGYGLVIFPHKWIVKD
ncbi:MAG TPA: ABC transporter ATP-binding protein [Anaerolineaceae bacterium]